MVALIRPTNARIAMEVLCTIPVEPFYALIADLREDFSNIRGRGGVKLVINKLIRDGYDLRLMKVFGQEAVQVRRHGWAKVNRDAEDYWNLVHME